VWLGEQYTRAVGAAFHVGALRNNNTRLLRTLGPDTGFDSIGDWPQATALCGISTGWIQQPACETILYNLTPADIIYRCAGR